MSGTNNQRGQHGGGKQLHYGREQTEACGGNQALGKSKRKVKSNHVCDTSPPESWR